MNALRSVPNIISTLRLLSVPVLVFLIVSHRFEAALLLCIPIGLSDWADGYLARTYELRSELGLFLDPAADKVLLVSAFLSLGFIRSLPVWLVAIVLGRDLVIVIGTFLLWRLRGYTHFVPLFSGKISTAFQILTILIVLSANLFPRPVLRDLQFISFALTGFFTILSGIAYVRKGIRMASDHRRASHTISH